MAAKTFQFRCEVELKRVIPAAQARRRAPIGALGAVIPASQLGPLLPVFFGPDLEMLDVP
jgi:hypothetical protein